jgi:hypothetical protein
LIVKQAFFGMNVREISPGTKGTLPHYIGAALAMTLATIWIIVAFHSQYVLPKGYSFFKRLFWPVLLLLRWLGWIKLDDEEERRTKAGDYDEMIDGDTRYPALRHTNPH